MPRTYLKSTGASKYEPSTKNKTVDKQKKTTNNQLKADRWRTLNTLDSSDESIGTVRTRQNDDVFDQLFANVDMKKILIPQQNNNSGGVSSDFNSTNTPDRSERCFGLFKSFDDGSFPRVERKTSHKARSKLVCQSVKSRAENKENVESQFEDTLLGELNFASESPVSSLVNLPDGSSPAASDTGQLYQRASQTVESPNLFFQTPGEKVCRKPLPCITSTPLLSKDTSVADGSMMKAPSTVDEDDVFLPQSASPCPSNELPVPAPATLRHSSEGILFATPDRLVKKQRGKKAFGGPALSLMNQLNWKLTKNTCLQIQEEHMSTSNLGLSTDSESAIASPETESVPKFESDESDLVKSCTSKASDGRDSSADSASLPSATDFEQTKSSLLSYEREDITVCISCVCDNTEIIPGISLIICDICSRVFHANCVGLNEHDISLIVVEKPDWFCPKCREAKNCSSLSFTDLSFTSTGTDTNRARVERSNESATTECFDASQMTGDNTKECAPSFINESRDSEEGVIAKPGKNWRRSICAQLNKDLDTTNTCRRNTIDISRNSQVTKFEDFIVPQVPTRGFVSTRRQSTRQSARVSQFHQTLQGIHEESALEWTQSARASKDGVNPGNDTKRTSFYIVPNQKQKDTSIPDASILTEPEISDFEKLLSRCSEARTVSFDDVYDGDSLKDSVKVGEGAFGEVYLVGSDSVARPVLKVVPIGGELKVNDEDQTTFADMMSEVVISRSLSNLRLGKRNFTDGFVEVRKCVVFEGSYPAPLLELWDDFDREKTSENQRPDFLPVDQKYIALEFNNGGRDLEKYEFRNAVEALAAWKQVAHTLATAEVALEFEHRDLHWGNILIKEATRKTREFVISGDTYTVDTCNVETTIIDFSLSRLTSGEDECTIFNNLAQDPTLFAARGLDKGGDYQFDVYRLMRSANGNLWEAFNPKTNIFWLHYILEKMVSEVYYKAKKNSKVHKTGLSAMRKLKSNLLEFDSAHDWVRKDGKLVLD